MTLRERIAEKEHEQWAHWTKYMLDNWTPENIERWKRQADTPYSILTESEKDADRKWADIILSNPITAECPKCRGMSKWARFPFKCPHCEDGQRVIMKTRTCPIRKLTKELEHLSDCDCKGHGEIKEPLTLNDIDFTGELKLKDNWEVDCG